MNSLSLLVGALTLTCSVMLGQPAMAAKKSSQGPKPSPAQKPPQPPKPPQTPPAGKKPADLTEHGQKPAHPVELPAVQTPPQGQLPPQAQTPPGPKSPSPNETKGMQQIQGKLTLLDGLQHLIGVAPQQGHRVGAEVQIKVDDSTKVILHGKPGGITDLTGDLVNSRVVVIFERGATPPLARLIVVLGEPQGGPLAE